MAHRIQLALVLLALVLALAPLAAWPAGLGRLALYSMVGEPLNAEIEIVSLQPSEAGSLAATVAPPDVYRQAQIAPLPNPDAVRVAIERRPDGRQVVKVSSTTPVDQPLVNLLVELSWAGGGIVRQYSFLLDSVDRRPPTAAAPAAAPTPPTASAQLEPVRASAPDPAPVAAAPAAPAPAAPAPGPVAARDATGPAVAAAPAAPAPAPIAARDARDPQPAPVAAAPAAPASEPIAARDARDPQPAPVAVARAAPAAVPVAARDARDPQPARPALISLAAASGDYTVQPGDTLGKIAQATLHQGVTVPQMSVAIFRANESAFLDGNMNHLKVGRTLKIPDRAAAAAVPLEEARKLVAAQRAPADAVAARSAAGGPAAASGPSGDDLAALDRAIAESRDRAGELEKTLTGLKQLIEGQDRQIEELQRQLGKAPAKSAARK
ncbi:MAG TPA: FimV/HubP family polar landmark protein [Burkholderiales bacterium]|nr:FimV/HubP family polar landmark protein [Burkholderiales bacterium]